MSIITYNYIETKLGRMIAGATEKGLCLLEFEERKNYEAVLTKIEKKYSAKLIQGNNKILNQTKEEINKYFDGALKNFTVPLDIKGTEFQKRVWSTLRSIPYGKTISYMELAKLVENPTGFRAVANANGNNNIAIVIPCHRVIASNGKLQGYAGGLWRKENLLKLEGFTSSSKKHSFDSNKLEKWVITN